MPDPELWARRLQNVDAGYRSDGVLSAQIYGNFSRYGNINALRRLYLPVLDGLEGADPRGAGAPTGEALAPDVGELIVPARGVGLEQRDDLTGGGRLEILCGD